MPEPAADTIELDLQGMTCAACAGRIERKLNKMPGVTASVNFALERASVSGSADVDALIATVRAAGYDATEHREQATEPDNDEARAYLRRFIIAAVLSVPVIAVAMVPAWQFAGWQWVSMGLTLPVVCLLYTSDAADE